MKRREWLLKQQKERWEKLWQGAAAWGSVPPTEDWRRPFRMLGLIELKEKPERRPPPPPQTLNCALVHETEKAWLVDIEGREHWMPKSQCKLSDDWEQIEVPRWLWLQKQAEED
jgi:hypothetical protein